MKSYRWLICNYVVISTYLVSLGNSFSRQIKESMFIRTNNPSMNRNIGKYELPRVYDVLVENCIDLKFKWCYLELFIVIVDTSMSLKVFDFECVIR